MAGEACPWRAAQTHSHSSQRNQDYLWGQSHPFPDSMLVQWPLWFFQGMKLPDLMWLECAVLEDIDGIDIYKVLYCPSCPIQQSQ